MSTLELVVLSAALGTDLFSVAIPIGMNRVRKKVILRAAVVFAVFHIVMILTGYYIGHWLGTMVEHLGSYHINASSALVENWASILGAVVLVGLGAYMIKQSLSEADPTEVKKHPLKGMTLIMLATSVSIDALAAGFSLGMMDVDLLKLSVILGVVIFMIATIGLGLGRRMGRYIGTRSEIVGGSVLVLLGAHILYTTLS
ncbi:putative manganese efflux pump MntP [bioreactor metagenome]|uniref:Putative manganese efflux pump MntP n=1 Tax=bioreactor metagenome TaxID=1076179 RepID=A0A644TPR3_9ZZZZ|nr:manganese efflux pump MntP family protein [Negativicutes bacterium]